MPTTEQSLKALTSRLAHASPPKNLNLGKVAEAAAGLSFADLDWVVNDALKKVIIGGAKRLSTKLLLEELQRRKDFLSKNRRAITASHRNGGNAWRRAAAGSD